MSGGHDGFAHTRAAGLHISSLIHRCLAFSDALAALVFPVKLVHCESQTLVFFLSNIMPLSQSDVKYIRALNLPHVLSRGSSSASQKGHSESLRIPDHLSPSLSGRDQMGHDPFKCRNPFQILARVIFVSCALASAISASYFDISYEIRAL